MKVTYQGSARRYQWQDKSGKITGGLDRGETGNVPDDVLAGSLASKGVRHMFVKDDGSVVTLADLPKKAQQTAAAVAPAGDERA